MAEATAQPLLSTADELASGRQDLPAAPVAARRHEWLEAGLLVAVLLGGAVALSNNTADADLWGHILFGLETIAAGSPPATATHTFTAEGFPWINHENLSEVALAVMHHYGGGRGLLVAKCLLGLAVLGSMVVVARRRAVAVTAICAVTLVVAINMTAGWTLRPQLATFTGVALLALILDAAFADWQAHARVRWGWLWLVVPLMFLWVNAHGGFLAGCGLLALYLGVRIVEALWHAGWSMAAKLAAVGSCAALATLLNPYGPRMHQWLVEAMVPPSPEITEWARLTPGSAAFWPAVLLFGLTAAALAGTTRRRDPAQLLLIVVAAWQGIAHVRHLPILAVLVGYWIPVHMDALLARLRRPATTNAACAAPEAPLSRRRFALAASAIAAVCLLLFAVLVARTRQLQVDRGEFPVAAIAYMTDHGLNGRLLSTFNWAEYALAALPASTVAFDGRFNTCYPRDVLDMHFDFVLGDEPGRRWRSPHSPPADAARALRHAEPELVLVDRRQPRSIATVLEEPGWVLLYQDGIAQLWGRRERFGDPASGDYVPPALRQIDESPQQGYVAWPALPRATTEGGRTAGRFPPLRLPQRRGDT